MATGKISTKQLLYYRVIVVKRLNGQDTVSLYNMGSFSRSDCCLYRAIKHLLK